MKQPENSPTRSTSAPHQKSADSDKNTRIDSAEPIIIDFRQREPNVTEDQIDYGYDSTELRFIRIFGCVTCAFVALLCASIVKLLHENPQMWTALQSWFSRFFTP